MVGPGYFTQGINDTESVLPAFRHIYGEPNAYILFTGKLEYGPSRKGRNNMTKFFGIHTDKRKVNLYYAGNLIASLTALMRNDTGHTVFACHDVPTSEIKGVQIFGFILLYPVLNSYLAGRHRQGKPSLSTTQPPRLYSSMNLAMNAARVYDIANGGDGEGHGLNVQALIIDGIYPRPMPVPGIHPAIGSRIHQEWHIDRPDALPGRSAPLKGDGS